MEVEITEKNSSKVIVRYPISVGSLNSEVSDEEYYSEAWRCAVDDKIVKDTDRSKYDIRFAE